MPPLFALSFCFLGPCEASSLAILLQIAFRLQLGVSPLWLALLLVGVFLDFVAKLAVVLLAELVVAPARCHCEFDLVVCQLGLLLRLSLLHGWTEIHNTHHLAFADRHQPLEVDLVGFLVGLLLVDGGPSYGLLILPVIFW